MKKTLFLVQLLILSLLANAQHTFSIVAVDSVTGEIGSAGATCGDSIIWPNTAGAIIISDVIPGIGAIHTQSYYNASNQTNANTRMLLNESPQQIINWLTANDVDSNPAIRQYGIVDYNNGSPRSAAFTGANCLNYKNHIVGPNYAIQGNILLGQEILDSMESRFNSTSGCLSDKLMAAMQGANVIGADTRCTDDGTSSLSAFLRVAKPDDHIDSLYIDLNIAGTPDGVEPINELQTKYNTWKSNHSHDCSPLSITSELPKEKSASAPFIYPNPTSGLVSFKLVSKDVKEILIINALGQTVISTRKFNYENETIQLSINHLKSGTYIVALIHDDGQITRGNIVLNSVK